LGHPGYLSTAWWDALGHLSVYFVGISVA